MEITIRAYFALFATLLFGVSARAWIEYGAVYGVICLVGSLILFYISYTIWRYLTFGIKEATKDATQP